ncbi:hypothetical protein J6590_037324 [Homalodisca vitripennis]|nr:hypothetical protein J6590_037324 [Homalodisca vitripennis]
MGCSSGTGLARGYNSGSARARPLQDTPGSPAAASSSCCLVITNNPDCFVNSLQDVVGSWSAETMKCSATGLMGLGDRSPLR